jgi:hypothetical protein
MKSKKLGKNTSKVEIHTSPFGVWVLVLDTEYFLSYQDYPWFKEAKISDLYDVELSHSTHLYWPNLDIDLDIDCLKNPEKYPLIYHDDRKH